MNNFTKSLLAAALPCAASAQGLYSIAPNDDEASESLPITYTAGVAVGYDDNPNPLFGDAEESSYISGFVQANWTSVTPQTTWDIFARVGVRHFFEDFESPSALGGVGNSDSTNYNASVGVNFTKRFNERLRFSTRNLLAYETEPDFSFGIGTSNRAGNYFSYSSQNSIGYRWTERFGTQTGFDFAGIRYDDLDNSDFNQFTFRQQGRYRLSPATVVTAEYRYGIVDADVSGDQNSHFILAGVEHRFNPVSAIVLRAGAQIVDPDGGDTFTTPFVEAALRSQLTDQLGVNTFVRYSSEGFNRVLQSDNGLSVFEESQTVRLGVRANYAVNGNLSFFGGLNLVFTDYENEISGSNGSGSETLYNLNAGFSYEFVESVFLTGSYNYTNAVSDFDGREYDRNRFELGLQTTF